MGMLSWDAFMGMWDTRCGTLGARCAVRDTCGMHQFHSLAPPPVMQQVHEASLGQAHHRSDIKLFDMGPKAPTRSPCEQRMQSLEEPRLGR